MPKNKKSLVSFKDKSQSNTQKIFLKTLPQLCFSKGFMIKLQLIFLT